MIMSDPTEATRRTMTAEINSKQAERERLEAEHGQVWNTSEMQKDFTAIGFMAPFIVVKRKSDGVKGSLMFQHDPRFYFAFNPE
jgi:hypothetical protein